MILTLSEAQGGSGEVGLPYCASVGSRITWCWFSFHHVCDGRIHDEECNLAESGEILKLWMTEQVYCYQTCVRSERCCTDCREPIECDSALLLFSDTFLSGPDILQRTSLDAYNAHFFDLVVSL